MNAERIKQFKALFETQKQGLLYSQTYLNQAFNIHSEELSDEVDLSSVELEQSMRIRLRNREALFIKKLHESLEKIQAGKFGVCECCEEDIEYSRLEARPTASLCLSCKENEEMQETRSADGRLSKSMGFKLKLKTA